MILVRKYFTGTDDVPAHDYNRPIKELKIREKEGKTNEKTEEISLYACINAGIDRLWRRRSYRGTAIGGWCILL
jgi:hypothetical protein